jgi:uncharacterized protein YigA (DUF484 family)
MNADEVAAYLQSNPGFFEDHAELLTGISVPHPHDGKAIPLADRQVMALRDENKSYRAKLAELIQFGEENVAISDKMHRLALALLPARDLAGLLSAFHYNLREDFTVPHTAIRLWRPAAAGGEGGAEIGNVSAPVSDALRAYVQSLAEPYCGPSGSSELHNEAAGWFAEGAPHVRSVALVALAEPGPAGAVVREGASRCFGLLAFGSEDVLRFYPDMGTLYLKRLGDYLGAALTRFLE